LTSALRRFGSSPSPARTNGASLPSSSRYGQASRSPAPHRRRSRASRRSSSRRGRARLSETSRAGRPKAGEGHRRRAHQFQVHPSPARRYPFNPPAVAAACRPGPRSAPGKLLRLQRRPPLLPPLRARTGGAARSPVTGYESRRTARMRARFQRSLRSPRNLRRLCPPPPRLRPFRRETRSRTNPQSPASLRSRRTRLKPRLSKPARCLQQPPQTRPCTETGTGTATVTATGRTTARSNRVRLGGGRPSQSATCA
jgi:hypothetical protein